jgi:hypothetical protein
MYQMSQPLLVGSLAVASVAETEQDGNSNNDNDDNASTVYTSRRGSFLMYPPSRLHRAGVYKLQQPTYGGGVISREQQSTTDAGECS